MHLLPFIVIAIAFIILLIAIWALVRNSRLKIRQAWLEAAAALDLDCDPDQPSIEGVLNGVEVTANTFTIKSTDGSQNTRTAIKADLAPALPGGLTIFREVALFNSLGKLVGWQDILTGDQRFDDKFLIKAQDPLVALKFLNNDVRSAIVEYDRKVDQFRLESDRLCYDTFGVISDPNHLKTVLEAQSKLANILRGAHHHNQDD